MQIALVYQCGIANVFTIGGGERRRLLQHAFSACEWFADGASAVGATVTLHHCDKAGDIAGMDWADGPGDMFADAKRPPRST